MGLRLIVNDGRDVPLLPALGGPAGGIKTAALAVCAGLARRGHEVHLFGRCPAPGRYAGVTFHDGGELARFAAANPADALVLIPELLPLLLPVRARARVVWTGNAYQGGDCALAAAWPWAPGMGRRGARARLYGMAVLHPYTDRVVAKSRWQAAYAVQAAGIPRDKLAVIGNGVPLEHYAGPAPARHPRRLVYTSQARRGLDVLLRLFPKVRAAVPGAELHVFGVEYAQAGLPRHLPGAGQPGVHWRGALGKAALARELRSTALMAYPCTLKETFCTAVAEAQSAGLPVVTSRLAALAERVDDGVDGFLIPGKPGGSPGYEAAFVGAVVRLLRDGGLRARMGEAAARKARLRYDWRAVVDAWEGLLCQVSAGREPLPPRHDPGLDLLDPARLRVAEGGAAADVPAGLARRWLGEACASYGFGADDLPGLAAAGGPGGRAAGPCLTA
jgi:glycosyltransferase involved in cell wall biosynthesis